MTENKSLKRRVRERMSKTGERYTAARRQILDKSPSAAPTHATPAQPEPLHGPTARTLTEWFTRLEAWGAADRSHTDIARWLNRDQGVDGWWAQDITVRYEKHIGRRVLGQRGNSFSATASKTIAVPAERAFEAWVDQDRRAAWLPEPTLYQRTATPHRMARFDVDGGPGRVVVGFDSKGADKVVVALEHEKLANAAEAEQWKLHWRGRLLALKQLLEA